MKKMLGALIAAVTLLAGCASFEFHVERISEGRLTPPDEKVPDRVVGTRSPFGYGCNPCGGGINSGGGNGTVTDILGKWEKVGPQPRKSR